MVIYESALAADDFYNSRVIKDFENSKGCRMLSWPIGCQMRLKMWWTRFILGICLVGTDLGVVKQRPN